MVALSDKCLIAVALSIKVMLDDRTWRSFGYKKRPKRGSFFNRFVNETKLKQEKTLYRELWAVTVAEFVNWARSVDHFPHRVSFAAKVLEHSVDGLTPETPFWPTLKFDTRVQSVDFLSAACTAYAVASSDDKVRVMATRLAETLGPPLPPVWAVGVSMLFIHPESPIVRLQQELSEPSSAEVQESDVTIRDPWFSEIVSDLFERR